MNSAKFGGIILNLIIYIIMIFPIILVLFKKSIYKNKKTLLTNLIFITILEVGLSIILYLFSKYVFSIFANTSGIINYAIFASKIIFISSSLYGIKFLIPAFLYKFDKKTTILFLSKIVVNLIFIFIAYNLFSTKGALYSLPICDFIYYIIYIILFIKIDK